MVFTLPPNITAWSGVIEPNQLAILEITVTASDGTTLTQKVDNVDPNAGGPLFGFEFFNGATITTATVIPGADSGGFAIAQMQISDTVICLSGVQNVCTSKLG